MLLEYATILFRLKVRTARPPRFEFKNRLSSVREVETSFRRMNVTGDGRLTREEMLRGDDFTRAEVRPHSDNVSLAVLSVCADRGHVRVGGHQQGRGAGPLGVCR